jgi:hypothetical protein
MPHAATDGLNGFDDASSLEMCGIRLTISQRKSLN